MADFTITPANVQHASTEGSIGVAFEDIDAGELVYRMADGTYALAQADGTALQATVAGMAVNSCVAGQPFMFVGGGDRTVGSAFTSKGKAVVLSAAAGKMCPDADITTANHYKSQIGISSSATAITLNIQNSGIQMP